MGDKAVFHRVEMHIIDMGRIIALIPDRMLPITILPNTSLAYRRAEA